MIKIAFFKEGRRREGGKIKNSSRLKGPVIVKYLLGVLKQGESWELEFIDVDPEVQDYWERYEREAKDLFLCYQWLEQQQEQTLFHVKHSGSFSPFPIGMPISSLPQITEKPKPKIQTLSGGHILITEDEEVTLILAPIEIS